MDHIFLLPFKPSHMSWYTFWAFPSTLGGVAHPGTLYFHPNSDLFISF